MRGLTHRGIDQMAGRDRIVATISERGELGGEAAKVILGNLAVLLINDDVSERVIDHLVVAASHRGALTESVRHRLR